MTDKELHIKQQAEWVAHHKIVPGSKVEVRFKVPDYCQGSPCSWRIDMDKSVGKLMTVIHIVSLSGIELDDGWHYPFFCLRWVNNPEPKKAPQPATADFMTSEIAMRWGRGSLPDALAASVVKWMKVKDVFKRGKNDVHYDIGADTCPLCHWQIFSKAQCPLNPNCHLSSICTGDCCKEWYNFNNNPTEANCQIMIDKLLEELTKVVMNPTKNKAGDEKP